MRTIIVVIAAFALWPWSLAHAACAGPPAGGYAGWGPAAFPPGEGRTVAPNGMDFTVKQHTFATWIANAAVIDATFCVTFRMPDPLVATTDFGFVFWQEDADNFWIAVLNGPAVSVYQHVKNVYTQNKAQWQFVKTDRLPAFYVNGPQPPLLATATPDKPDSGVNQLEMILLGDDARILVNGHQISEVSSRQVFGRRSAGLFLESDADKDVTVHILSLAISSLCSHGEAAGYCS